MAVLALAGAGAIIGGGIGSAFGAAALGASIGWSLGGLAGNMLFGPRPPNTVSEGPRLGDLSVQTSTYGVPIPIIYGTVRISGNIIWSSGIREQRNVTTVRQRVGKGRPRRRTVTHTEITYSYFGSWAVGLCEGEAAEIIRIWMDDRLVYDATNTSGVFQINGLRWVFYKGTETQLPDPLIEANVGSNNAVPFRGLAYIVFDDVPLASFGNRIPSVSVEITKSNPPSSINVLGPTPSPPSYQNARPVLDYESSICVHFNANQDIRIYDLMTKTLIATYNNAGIPICAGGGLLYAVTSTTSAGTGRLINIYTGEVIKTRSTSYLTSSVNSHAAIGIHDTHFFVRVFDGYEFEYFIFVVTNDGFYCMTVPDLEYVFGSKTANSEILFPANIDSNLTSNSFSFPGEERLGESDIYVTRTVSSEIRVGRVTIENGARADGQRLFGVRYSPVGTYTAASLSATSVNTTHGFFDPFDKTIVLRINRNNTLSSVLLMKIRNDGSIVYTSDAVTPSYISNNMHHLNRITNHYIWYPSGFSMTPTDCYLIDLRNGNRIKTRTFNGIPEPHIVSYYSLDTTINGGHMQATDPTFGWSSLSFDITQSVGQSLSSIVSDICQKAGLTSSQINVAALASTTVKGYVISRQMSARNAIEPLATAFNFDAVERGSSLVFRTRNGSIVETISQEDFVRKDEQPLIEETRAQDADLPRSVAVRYLDIDRDYEIGTQRWQRNRNPVEIVTSVNDSTIDLPIVLSANEAKALAQRIVLSSWIERTKLKFTVSTKHIRLEPTDPITVNRPTGATSRCRIVSAQLMPDYSLDIEAVEETPATFTAQADVGQGFVQQKQVSRFSIFPIIPNLPLLRDSDDTKGQSLRLYASASTTSSDSVQWAPVEVSLRIDAIWSVVDSIVQDAPFGVVEGTVPEPISYWTWDNQTEIVVRMFRGGSKLSSSSDLEVLNGDNVALLFNGQNKVELIQFANVTFLGNNRYRLSRLLRGRRGTEDAGPFSGAFFILLEEADFARYTRPPSSLNTAEMVGFFGPFDDETSAKKETRTIIGRAEQPFAPVHIRGTRDASNNLTITWVRRTRLTAELVDFTGDVPLHEQSEAYEVWIRNMADTATLRTFTGLSSPTVTYTAAQQTTDGITPGDPVRVRVFQVSALVGRGRAGSAIV